MSHVNLHYETYGTGNTLVFLHGYGSNLNTWKFLAPYLQEKYRLILIDLKGFGSSPKPADGCYSIHDQVSEVLNFIHEKKLENITLVGHSTGGGVALLVALRLQLAGNKPRALILIDSAAYPEKLRYMGIINTPLLGNLVLLLSPLVVKIALKEAYYDKSKISKDRVAMYTYPFRNKGYTYVLKQTVKQIMPPDMEDLIHTYSDIESPTLVLWGACDKVIAPARGYRLHNQIKGSKLVVLERSGHAPQEELPEQTAKEINQFLEGLNKDRTLEYQIGFAAVPQL